MQHLLSMFGELKNTNSSPLKWMWTASNAATKHFWCSHACPFRSHTKSAPLTHRLFTGSFEGNKCESALIVSLSWYAWSQTSICTTRHLQKVLWLYNAQYRQSFSSQFLFEACSWHADTQGCHYYWYLHTLANAVHIYCAILKTGRAGFDFSCISVGRAAH